MKNDMDLNKELVDVLERKYNEIQQWIDTKKFNVAMSLIYEIGKIIGGLVKYYAKNDTK